MFDYKDKSKIEKSVNDFIDVTSFYEKIRKSEIELEKAEKNKNEFKSRLTRIKRLKKIRWAKKWIRKYWNVFWNRETMLLNDMMNFVQS